MMMMSALLLCTIFSNVISNFSRQVPVIIREIRILGNSQKFSLIESYRCQVIVDFGVSPCYDEDWSDWQWLPNFNQYPKERTVCGKTTDFTGLDDQVMYL